jgi:Dolichyl-phosphate-mannose-protein mannosyltransferase
VGIVALVGGAVCVRVWLMVDYPPAFLGFGDSWQYAFAAARDIFNSTQHPAGYPLFLNLIHRVSSSLSFVIAVQHATGVATGLLLYQAVRRTGVPPWLGLLPAAIVFFGATGLILEHSLLADPLLTFLQAIDVYFAVRALYDPSLRWPLLAGIAIGLSFWVKTVALSSAVLIPLVLLCAAPGGIRRRLLSALTASFAVMVFIVAYVGIQYYSTGYLGYERESAWNLYGRVATFVDCSDFTPPNGTRFLCPSQPLRQRESSLYYQNATTSPAVERFGNPVGDPPYANALLQEFSVAAIEHEPVAYAEAIVRGLGFYVSPHNGEGYTPQYMRAEVMNAINERANQPAFALLYSDSLGYSGTTAAARPIATYESYTLVQGPFLIILLVVAIGGLFFLPRAMRWAATIFTFTALFSITFAVAGNSYDARYAYPTFGPLAAGAALGAWGMGLFLTRTIRQLRRRQRLVPS